MSVSPSYQHETLSVTKPKEYVIQVEINRPERRNAMSMTFYREFQDCFKTIASDSDCRAVVLCGAGKLFSSGIDLADLASFGISDTEPGRRGFMLRSSIFKMQESMNSLEKCLKPVIAAVHNACIGAAVDTVVACDMRYCSEDAFFQVKEVDLGITADLGTLQRLPRILGNDSLARELCYSARKMMSDEALRSGLVNRVFPDRDSLINGAVEMASLIASKSPVAVQGTKVSLLYSRDHSVPDAMDHILTWNQSMLQSEDVMKAGMAYIEKKTPTFSKL